MRCTKQVGDRLVRDEEQHLLNLARTRDLDSPEGKPTLPWMGRVRSAAAERNGPRGDAQSEDSASAMALQSASQGNPNVDNRTSDRTNIRPDQILKSSTHLGTLYSKLMTDQKSNSLTLGHSSFTPKDTHCFHVGKVFTP